LRFFSSTEYFGDCSLGLRDKRSNFNYEILKGNFLADFSLSSIEIETLTSRASRLNKNLSRFHSSQFNEISLMRFLREVSQSERFNRPKKGITTMRDTFLDYSSFFQEIERIAREFSSKVFRSSAPDNSKWLRNPRFENDFELTSRSLAKLSRLAILLGIFQKSTEYLFVWQ
jgi:hypothetical protein